MSRNSTTAVRTAIMGRLIAQADDDLTEASDYCREARDESAEGARADLRYAAEKLDEARDALQQVRARLSL